MIPWVREDISLKTWMIADNESQHEPLGIGKKN